MFQDLGDLGEPGAEETHQEAGDGDEDQGAAADKPISFCRGVKDGGELVHQGDDGHRQKGEPDAAALPEGKQVGPAQ